MTDRAEFQLRDLLRPMQGRASVSEVEAVFPSLLAVRLECEEAILSAATAQRHIEVLRSRTIKAQRGYASWLVELLRRRPVLTRYALPVGAILVAAAMLISVLLNQTGGSDKDRLIASPETGGSAPDKTPEPTPEGRAGKEDLPKNQKDPGIRRPNSREGLLARRTQVGAFGRVMGNPIQKLPDEEKGHLATPNAPLYAGTTILTGDASRAEVVFEDGSQVVLDYNSEVTVESSSARGNVRLDLKWGRIVARVKPRLKSDSFAVHTPVATAEVLGTVFSLKLDGVRTDPSTYRARLQVEEGEVQFGNARGFRRVGSLQESSTFADGVPSEPKRISNLGWFQLSGSHRLNVSTSKLTWNDAQWVVESPYGRLQRGANSSRGSRGQAELLAISHKLAAGSPIAASRELTVLVRSHPTPTAFSLLGIAFEMQDRMGEAIAAFQEAVSRTPRNAQYRHHLARCLKKIGNLERSAEESAKAVELDPGWLEALAGYADTLNVLGRQPQAVRVLASAEARFRNDPKYWLRLGFVVLAAEGPSKAFPIAVRLVEFAPRYEPGWRLLAEVHHDRERLKEAERCCRNALAIDPNSVKSRTLLARVLFEQDRLIEAKAEYERVIATEPSNSYAHLGLAIVLWDLGKSVEAEAQTRLSLNLEPNNPLAHVFLGRILVDPRPAEAVASFDRALELDPDNSEAHYFRANSLYALRRFEEAERSFERCIWLDPKNYGALSNYGELLLRKGQKEAAATLFERSIAVGAKEPFPYIRLARLRLEAGQKEEARDLGKRAARLIGRDLSGLLAVFTILLDLEMEEDAESLLNFGLMQRPNDPELNYRIGRFYADRNRLNEAVVRLGVAVEKSPGNSAYLAHYCWTMAQMGKFDDAEAALSRALTLSPNNPAIHGEMGTLRERQRRYAEAEPWHRKAYELSPNNPDFAYRLGRNLANRAEKLEEAVELIQQAIGAKPENAEYVGLLGVAYLNMKQFAKAAEILDRAVELYGRSPDAWEAVRNLGTVHYILGNDREGKSAYRRLAALRPDQLLSAERRLAVTLDNLGKPELAENAYRRALALTPKDPYNLNSLAWHLVSRGIKLDEALEFATKGMEVAPKDASMVDTLGWIQFRRGELDDAEKWLRRALEMFGTDPTAADTWANLGEVLEAKKDVEGAKAAYRKALAISSSHKRSVDALKRLGLS